MSPRIVALVALLVAVFAGTEISSAIGATGPRLRTGPLETALMDDPSIFEADSGGLAMRRTRAAGTSAVRLLLRWSSIAPSGVRPGGFDAANPFDPNYRWQAFDHLLALARSHGLTPIVSVDSAPTWAEGPGSGSPGTVRPNPVEFGRFARAAALRYSGRFDGLPAVRHWQAWNEPNIHLFLNPQFEGKRPVSPGWYRRMVIEFARAVRSVHPRNLVIAGGLAPFRDLGVTHRNWGPLSFMREFLCVSSSMKPTCNTRVPFDIWSHHPYTSGGPTRDAVLPDDVSLGDLDEMRRLLVAAAKAGHIDARYQLRFWVTEFSWDSNPPDPKGVPSRLHRRWVAEALFRMWRAGVSLVTWFQLTDHPPARSFYQSGLYYRGLTIDQDRPKPALRAFRFPFVGFPRRQGVYVWGRTPAGKPGRVVVEQSASGGWRRLGVLRTNRYGIFERRFRGPRVGSVRARVVGTGERAVPFSLKHHPDRFFNPFGQPTLLEPRRKGRP
jgi:hypothetical protein